MLKISCKFENCNKILQKNFLVFKINVLVPVKSPYYGENTWNGKNLTERHFYQLYLSQNDEKIG